jgi:predicted dehydrogenase
MKIGILNVAHLHADAYIQNLRQVPGVEVIGVADENGERGQNFAQQYETHAFRSYEELLATHPDGVIICSENARHYPLVKLAASAGVPVLCEKPLATRLEDAREMVELCQKAGVQLMIAFPMRFSSPLIEVKARLDAGDLGQVYCFNTTNQGQMSFDNHTWFVDKELAGGGAVMDHTVHLVDILRWFTGSEIQEVYARTNRVFMADQVKVETGGLEMITFQNGMFASIDCSWSRPPFWPSWGGLSMEIVSERGAVMVDAFRQNLTVYSRSLQRPAWQYWGSDANQAMIDEFIACIRENRVPCVDGMDGYRAVEVALAAYESDRTGQPVKL